MANPENDNRTDDAKVDEQNEQSEQAEATEELGDLEPKKDVKGGRMI